jgi:hypothetical protein
MIEHVTIEIPLTFAQYKLGKVSVQASSVEECIETLKEARARAIDEFLPAIGNTDIKTDRDVVAAVGTLVDDPKRIAKPTPFPAPVEVAVEPIDLNLNKKSVDVENQPETEKPGESAAPSKPAGLAALLKKSSEEASLAEEQLIKNASGVLAGKESEEVQKTTQASTSPFANKGQKAAGQPAAIITKTNIFGGK